MLRRVVVGSVLAVAVAGPAVPALAHRAPTLTGTYQRLVVHGTNGRHALERDVLRVGRRSYTMNLGDRARRLQGGERLAVRGRVSGATITPTTVDVVTASRSALEVATAATPVRVLVVLAHWTAPDAVTPQSARSMMFGEAAAWESDVSYGKRTFTGDVTPWLRIAGPGGLCLSNSDKTMLQARAAALLAGFDASQYQRVVVYHPQQGSGTECEGIAGWAYEPGDEVWLNGNFSLRVVTHELGHNDGMPHAASYRCSTSAGYVTFGSSCAVTEYGDPADAMGSAPYVGHFSASQKNRVGWLANRVADLSAGGTVTLQPYEATRGTAAAVIVTPSGRRYWIERRTPTGADRFLPTGLTNGVLVHVTDRALSRYPLLLDFTPEGSFANAALPFGSTWQTPEGTPVRIGQPVAGGGVPVTVGSFTAPSAPTAVAATPLSGAATVTWAPPLDDGGSPVTQYVVATTGVAPVSVPATTRSVTLSGLTGGTSYVVSVTAVSLYGSSVAATTNVVPTAVRVQKTSVWQQRTFVRRPLSYW